VADATADDTTPYDSVCRTFVPAAGIDEDPVTGSAHCVIAPWLAARHGRTAFLGRQASARGGTIGMEVRNDRVVLSGTAVTVSTGTLLVDPPS
jgi:predicted PhzF superfamily epimerase YddE/YHI9